MQVNEYKPLIVAFCCNWCSYAGADLAGNNRLNYPADVKIIRVPCSCRVNPMFILRAFQRGADGVIKMCIRDRSYTAGITRAKLTMLIRGWMLPSIPALSTSPGKTIRIRISIFWPPQKERKCILRSTGKRGLKSITRFAFPLIISCLLYTSRCV